MAVAGNFIRLSRIPDVQSDAARRDCCRHVGRRWPQPALNVI